jgi:hypothetical protein
MRGASNDRRLMRVLTDGPMPTAASVCDALRAPGTVPHWAPSRQDTA